MSRCLAETCRYWTGDGCACALLDIEPEWANVGPTDGGTNHRSRVVTATVPQATRTAVLERSKFRCERCGTRQMTGLHMSHRQPRGMGGSKTRGRPHHRLSNVNSLCAKCHLRFVEAYPTLAIAEGWKVKSGLDPSTIPILMYDGWHLCLDTGTRVKVA